MSIIAQQKCRFLSQHRGLKELNYLLEHFTKQAGPSIWSDPLYQELMTYDDMWLWDALMYPQNNSQPDHLTPLIERIRSTHEAAQS